MYVVFTRSLFDVCIHESQKGGRKMSTDPRNTQRKREREKWRILSRGEKKKKERRNRRLFSYTPFYTPSKTRSHKPLLVIFLNSSLTSAFAVLTWHFRTHNLTPLSFPLLPVRESNSTASSTLHRLPFLLQFLSYSARLRGISQFRFQRIHYRRIHYTRIRI